MASTQPEKQNEPAQGDRVEETKYISDRVTGEDVEQAQIQRPEDEHDTSAEHDEFEVTWDGDDDPSNPMNWSNSRKISIIAMVSIVTFLT